MIIRIALAVFFIAGFAMSAFAQAPTDGVWRGTGTQADAAGVQATWAVRMTIHERGDSAIEYPDLNCKGVLKRVANGHDGYEFNEKITEGACIDRGRIVVKQRSGRVFWFWYRPGVGGPEASAVLYRDDLVS
jgi:hypothetical protein